MFAPPAKAIKLFPFPKPAVTAAVVVGPPPNPLTIAPPNPITLSVVVLPPLTTTTLVPPVASDITFPPDTIIAGAPGRSVWLPIM